MALDSCHVCGENQLAAVLPYAKFKRVTSDCKPWPAGGSLWVCGQCGTAQAQTNETWQTECNRIYSQYTIYHQSKGAEQAVFSPGAEAAGVGAGEAQAMARSDRLVDQIHRSIAIPSHGRLLDIGCGNGALLRAFHKRRPDWKLNGVEVGEQNRPMVEQIPGLEKFSTDPNIPGPFDLVSLVHVLEHIPQPVEFLKSLLPKLSASGLLLVEVPNCAENPFMFLVADHATHFFPAHLRTAIERAGFEIVVLATDWIAKEITAVARLGAASKVRMPQAPDEGGMEEVSARLSWLQRLASTCRYLAKGKRTFGIFGTSIAATWLFAELNGVPQFFVDEDPNRIGQEHLGRPIYGPPSAPQGGQIVLALPPAMARAIARRLEPIAQARQIEWVLPDEIVRGAE